jgi:hypothetical protein
MLGDREKLRAVEAERDALHAAIQAVTEQCDRVHGHGADSTAGEVERLRDIIASVALAAAGVDREDTEQPLDATRAWEQRQADIERETERYGHEMFISTGQADEPQRPCRHCGHYHRALCLTDNPHLDCDCPPRAGQVVPQQPTADEYEYRIAPGEAGAGPITESNVQHLLRAGHLRCVEQRKVIRGEWHPLGPVGQDTTGEQQQ